MPVCTVVIAVMGAGRDEPLDRRACWASSWARCSVGSTASWPTSSSCRSSSSAWARSRRTEASRSSSPRARRSSGQPTDRELLHGGSAPTTWSVPALVWLFLVACVILTFVFRATRFGFAVRAVGSNEEAARLTGYPITPHPAAGDHAGRRPLRHLGRLHPGLLRRGGPRCGQRFRDLRDRSRHHRRHGTRGWRRHRAGGALFGALIISTIAGGLTQFGVSADWSEFVTGAVIVGAVGFDAIVRRRGAAVMTAHDGSRRRRCCCARLSCARAMAAYKALQRGECRRATPARCWPCWARTAPASRR